jgi:putative copper resistance protein D
MAVLPALAAGNLAVTAGDLALDWRLDAPAALAVLVAAVAYGRGVRRLAARGRRWPVPRRVAFAGALAAVVVATQSGIGRWEGERFTVHMVQHVLLGLVAPLLVVLSAPVTLALQSGGPATRAALRRALHGRAGRVLGHPLVGWALFGGGLVVLYLTPALDLAQRSDVAHLAMHAHVTVAGVLFLAPLVGVDALPHRPPHPARLLAVLAAVPFHAVVAVALLSASSPVAPDAYPSLADQRSAAAVFWGAGELLTLAVAATCGRQWWVAEKRATAREDRVADAAAAAGGAAGGAGTGRQARVL